MVDQGGAVAVHPVESHQAVPTDGLGGGLAAEELVPVFTDRLGLGEVVGREALTQAPGEDVADGTLTRLVAIGAGDDAVLDHAADARDVCEGGAVDDVAGGGAHEGEELAVLDGPSGRWGHVRVDIAGGHRDARGQPRPLRRPGGERADPGAGRGKGVLQTGSGEVCEPGVQGGEVLLARVTAVLEHAAVSGRAGVAALDAGELPDDPVGCLDPPRAGGIDGRVLLQDLERLGVLPLGGDPSAVVGDPLLSACVGEGVDAVGLVLGRVVLPELGPGVRVSGPLGGLGERGAVGEHRQDRAGGEVGGDADDVSGIDAGDGERSGNDGAQYLTPVLGVLQGPVRRQWVAGAG